jgi:hypothetical protein
MAKIADSFIKLALLVDALILNVLTHSFYSERGRRSAARSKGQDGTEVEETRAFGTCSSFASTRCCWVIFDDHLANYHPHLSYSPNTT